MRLVVLALITALIASVAAVESAPPLRVISTSTIIADVVRNVGGPRVESLSLLAPGADAHVYQPTPRDVAAIAAARLVVSNGLGFEGWVDRLISESGYRGPLVVASVGVEALTIGAERQIDPHAWHDVRNVIIYAGNIRDALTALDPAGRDDYAALSDLYIAQLRALDAWARRQIASLPPERRLLVTSHDALHYFAHAYGLEVHAVEGIATGHEPNVADVSALIDLLRKRQVPSVFLENVASPKVLNEIAASSGARLGGALFSDSLGEPASSAGTYIGMIASNVRTVVAGLAK